jgi:hypothetical protein
MSIEQRSYKTSLGAQQLAAYLVAHYDPKEDLNAQSIGEGNNILVQIRKGDHIGAGDRVASIAIVADREMQGLTITLGEQQWLTPNEAGSLAVTSLLSLLITPWVLFALIWPAKNVIGRLMMPQDIWLNIDEYIFSQGGTHTTSQKLEHPASQ